MRQWARSPIFRGAEEEELFNIAYIEAVDLLTNKYRPICTVSTFLNRYLYGRLEYRYLTKVRGLKRWKNKYETPPKRDLPTEGSLSSSLMLREMLHVLHPDIRPMAEALSNGDSLSSVAEQHGVDPHWLQSVLQRHLSRFTDE